MANRLRYCNVKRYDMSNILLKHRIGTIFGK